MNERNKLASLDSRLEATLHLSETTTHIPTPVEFRSTSVDKTNTREELEDVMIRRERAPAGWRSQERG